jgi:hypothetical protein
MGNMLEHARQRRGPYEGIMSEELATNIDGCHLSMKIKHRPDRQQLTSVYASQEEQLDTHINMGNVRSFGL